jgi:hypothetical protein
MGETMADDMTHRSPQNRSQINLSEDYEVQYCTDKLEPSKAQLEFALREFGASADAVETELRQSMLASGPKQ